MLDSLPPTLSGINPLELEDVVAHVVPLLDYPDLLAARTLSRLWHKQVQKQLLPQSSAYWNEFLPEDKLTSLAANLDKTRVLTIDTKFYPGKSLASFPQCEARKALYAPLLTAMCDPDKNMLLEEIVFRGGMMAQEDLFPALPQMFHLKRLTIEPHQEMTYADRAGLLKILGTYNNPAGRGPGASLEELTMRYGRWHSTGSFNKASMAHCRIKKLVLDRVNMMDDNVTSVLQFCPQLEELVAVRTLTRWAIPMMKAMSTLCPQLKRLTFANGLPWNTTQMGWLTRYFTPDLEALTIHGYDGNTLEEMLDMLGGRFKDKLERLELRECQGTRSEPKEVGQRLVKYLAEAAPQLQHLSVPDAQLSLDFLLDDGRLLASRDLRTLEIGFDARRREEGGDGGQEDKHVFDFLADQFPKLRYLTLMLPDLLDPAQDLRVLKRLKDLMHVRLVVEELGPLVAAKNELKTFVFSKPGVWPLLSRFEIVYRHAQEEPSAIRELGQWFQQEARPAVAISIRQKS